VKRENAQARNIADNLAFETEKNLRELGDKLSFDQKQRVETALGRLNAALQGESVTEIKSAADALEGTWQSVSTELYQHVGAGQASGEQSYAGAQTTADASAGFGAGSAQGHNGDGIIDADYEVVD
jgi:molecular chaperone DnaK